MTALVEMFVAIIGALFELLASVVALIANLIFALLEFLVLLMTKGLAAASQRFRERRQRQAASAAAAPLSTSSTAHSAGQAAASSSKRGQSLVSIALAGGVLCVGVLGLLVVEWVNQQRVKTTRLQVKQIADSYAAQFRAQIEADVSPGKLPEQDSWRQPLELFVDQTLLGALVVVRSAGPDRRAGSIDDILSVRLVPARALDIGGELAKRGWQALRKRIAAVLTDDQPDKLPQEIDISEL